MLIFAHRGSHNRQIAENTLQAFKQAVDLGAHGIEFDLRTSRDNVPMVIHDENLHRVAGDARRVRDLTAHELQTVVLRGAGCIPSLNDVTSSIPSPIQFKIEVKDREALEGLIRKLQTSSGLRSRTIVSSFVLDDLVRLKEILPDVRTVNLNMSWPLFLRKRRFVRSLEPANLWGLGFPRQMLNRRRVAWLREQGFKVACWDQQPLRREAIKIIKLGVDIAILFKIEACPGCQKK